MCVYVRNCSRHFVTKTRVVLLRTFCDFLDMARPYFQGHWPYGFHISWKGFKMCGLNPKRCTMRDCRLLPQLNWILASFGLLHGVRWFGADVSELPIGPVFKDRVSKKKAGANQSGSLWAKTCASWRPLVCLAIPACDRIAGLSNRHLNYNWGWAYANGCPWWSF